MSLSLIGGHHDDAEGVPILLQFLENEETRTSRKHHVEHHQIWRTFTDADERAHSIDGSAHARAFVSECKFERGEDVGIIIDDQNIFGVKL